MRDIYFHKWLNFVKGFMAELYAMVILLLKGYWVMKWRYRNNYGEIDLIARRGDTIIFIEVKYRSSLETAAYAINSLQQKRITQSSRKFLSNNYKYYGNCNCRFDAFLIDHRGWFRHIKNAW